MIRAFTVSVLLLLATACGGDSEQAAAPAATGTVTGTVTASPSSTSSATPTPSAKESEKPDDPYEDYRDESGFVTKDDFASKEYGVAWPLTVDAGFLNCPESFGDGAGSVTFTTLDGDEYALNGQALHDYPEIGPITKRGHIVLPLIDAGLELC